MSNKNKTLLRTGIPLAVLAACMLIAPFYLPPYQTTQLSLIMVYVMVGYGLNILTGWTGKISLGHTFFFAIGAYVATILQVLLQWNEFLAALVAVLLSFVIGWLIGRSILRFKGLQLALATLALAVLTPMLIRRFSSVTGGEDGRPVPSTSFLQGANLAPDQQVFFLTAVCVVITMLIYAWSTRRKVGAAFLAISEQEVVAGTLGINAPALKAQAFAVSAGLAGLAGYCFAKVVGYLGAESFSFLVAISFLALIVVGGSRSLWGPWFGAIFIVLAPEVTADLNQAAPAALYGAVLLAVVFLLPQGIAGVGPQIARLIKQKLATKRHVRGD